MHEDPMIVSLRPAPQRAPHERDPSLLLSLKDFQKKPVVEDQAPVIAHTPHIEQRVMRKRQRRTIPGFVLVLGLFVVLTLALGLYLSFSSEKGISVTNNPAHISDQDVNALVTHVGALMLLPQGETPTIATVTDLNALSDQAFFAHAQLGDKVLMYPKSGQAILYDPSVNKIIQVGPLTVTK